MPDGLTIAVVTSVVTAALSGFTTYFGARAKIRQDLLAELDRDLRKQRMTVYGELWTLAEPLARYSPPGPLTEEGIRGVSERMRCWYFRNGIVMSENARKAYFALQKKLNEDRAGAAEPLDGKILKDLQDASRDLHTALCGDVGSRTPPMIGSAPRKKD